MGLASPVVDPDTGRRGSFGVICPFSHRNEDDPIVFPGAHHASHSHDYFGATDVDAHTTWTDLTTMGNTCDSMGDLSSYWSPTLMSDGSPVTPIEMAVYLRTPNGADPETIVAPPNGLELISVRHGWTCARNDTPVPDMPRCPTSAVTRLLLEYPDCWDGKNLSSDDHFAHMSVSINGKCPPTHPVQIAEMATEVRYKLDPDAGEYAFSSGPLDTAHADSIIVWDRPVLEREVRVCLRRKVNCDLTWFTALGGAQSPST